jgi:predicted deacylase
MISTADREKYDFAGLRVAPGERARTRIHVAELADGSSLELPVMVIRGARPGPIFYIGAGLHGDEVAGVQIVGRLITHLNVKSLRGTLLLVPVQNPLAFQAQHRFFVGQMLRSPMDQSPADPWTSFPGDPNGNLAALIAHALFEQLMRHAQYMIDIHTPTTGGRYAPFAFLPPPRCGKSVLDAEALASTFGADYILAADKGVYVDDKTPHTVLAELGIPAFGVEIGEGGRLDEADIKIGLHGLMNVLKQVGMIPGKPEAFGRRIIIRTMEITRATRGGILHLHVGLNEEVRQGQKVASVISPFGDVLEEIHARHSGPVVRIATLPIVSSGERVIQVGVRR